MSQFNTQKVSTLFHQALTNAEAERNRQGFKKLSEAIRKTVAANSSVASVKYLDERIHQQLLSASRKSEPTVGLYQNNLDDLAQYCSYTDFSHFERDFDMLNTFIDRTIVFDSLKKPIEYLVIYDEPQADYVTMKCEQSTFIKQSINWLYSPVDFVNQPLAMVLKQLSADVLKLIFVSNTADDELAKSIKEIQNCIWIILEDVATNILSKEQKPLTVQETHFNLLAQIIFTLSENDLTYPPNNQSHNKMRSTQVSNSSTVILGNVGEIKGEYISSRDMHININNYSKNKNGNDT